MAAAAVRVMQVRAFSREAREAARRGEQFTLAGTNPSITGKAGDIFFLQYAQPTSGGTIVVSDGNGVDLTGTMSSVYAPAVEAELWAEAGLTLTGSVAVATGYVLRGLPKQSAAL